MTNRVSSSSDLLRGTAYLAALARRAALASDDPVAREQALKLTPVANGLKNLARQTNEAKPASSGAASTPFNRHTPPAAVSAPDFQALMAAAAKKQGPLTALASDSMDRFDVALSMARSGSNAIEIAKSLGLTRGEVDLIINIANQK